MGALGAVRCAVRTTLAVEPCVTSNETWHPAPGTASDMYKIRTACRAVRRTRRRHCPCSVLSVFRLSAFPRMLFPADAVLTPRFSVPAPRSARPQQLFAREDSWRPEPSGPWSSTAAISKVPGSRARVSKSRLSIARVATAAPARPRQMPAAARRAPCPTTMRTTSAREAPSATRMPISWVRCETTYAITPYTPTSGKDDGDAGEEREDVPAAAAAHGFPIACSIVRTFTSGWSRSIPRRRRAAERPGRRIAWSNDE